MATVETVKIVIAGLDDAGKTSILTVLDKKYEFETYVKELEPTIKVEYNRTTFLGNRYSIVFWDMGGQKKYRKVYKEDLEMYFGDTDLLVYVIDIQNPSRFEESFEYLDTILQFYTSKKPDIPVIVSLHKSDPNLIDDIDTIEKADKIKEELAKRFRQFKILFQQTSIYDIISIVQMVSYALSVFDEKFFELYYLLETYIRNLRAMSIVLFDKNGIILSEFYNYGINFELYDGLMSALEKKIYLIKMIQEGKAKEENAFVSEEDGIFSTLHRVVLREDTFFVALLVRPEDKEVILSGFSKFLTDLRGILEPLLARRPEQ